MPVDAPLHSCIHQPLHHTESVAEVFFGLRISLDGFATIRSLGRVLIEELTDLFFEGLDFRSESLHFTVYRLRINLLLVNLA